LDQAFFKRLVGAAAIGGRHPQMAKSFSGISFLLSFFLCADSVKEKSERRSLEILMG
jgi:hypothetical protein